MRDKRVPNVDEVLYDPDAFMDAAYNLVSSLRRVRQAIRKMYGIGQTSGSCVTLQGDETCGCSDW